MHRCRGRRLDTGRAHAHSLLVPMACVTRSGDCDEQGREAADPQARHSAESEVDAQDKRAHEAGQAREGSTTHNYP
eukprot:2738888-Prymnesium_polylepis.1